MDELNIVVLAGPNGAGKSTTAKDVIRDRLGILHYVNADTLARGLSEFDSSRGEIMKTNGKLSVAERMRDTEGITQAITKAIRKTVREHKLLGYPIVVWRDGKVVWVPPEEIELTEEEMRPPQD